ncbi:TPA: hypothetical protein HA344_08455 [Candidatus Bathyarchaeota archaeon]|nr:hypothetical protein [Candidatus Bathyarchaeota archaeon]
MKTSIVIGSVVVIVVALLAMVWGSTYSVPDLVRVSYGLPLNWGVNTVVTIAGPVDNWSINMRFLAVDLVFWFAVLLVVQYLLHRQS